MSDITLEELFSTKVSNNRMTSLKARRRNVKSLSLLDVYVQLLESYEREQSGRNRNNEENAFFLA